MIEGLHYVEDEERCGPVDRHQWQELLQRGSILDDTLVWHEDMGDWSAWGSVKNSDTIQAFLGGVSCCVCNETKASDQILSFGSETVCAGCKDLYVQRMREGDSHPGEKAWRRKKTVILDRNGQLPDRCFKCNEPANGYRKKHQVVYHGPLVILLFLVIGIFALLLGKKAKLQLGICTSCRAKRRNGILLAIGGVGIFFISLLAAVSWDLPILFVFALPPSLIMAIAGIWKTQLVRAKKIDDEYLTIVGCGPKFMDSLPEFEA